MHLSLSLNESELIRQCIAGEEKGYTLLYQKYVKRIYNSIYRVVNNAADAEDILQDAFCIAFGQLDKLKNRDNFEGWLKRIAINQAISVLRKNKMVFAEDDLFEKIADEEFDMTEEMLFQCRVEDIKLAIQTLPDGYRTIISLHLFEDVSQEDIAKMLEISHNTVRSQYHRAKKKIFMLLKDKAYYGT